MMSSPLSSNAASAWSTDSASASQTLVSCADSNDSIAAAWPPSEIEDSFVHLHCNALDLNIIRSARSFNVYGKITNDEVERRIDIVAPIDVAEQRALQAQPFLENVCVPVRGPHHVSVLVELSEKPRFVAKGNIHGVTICNLRSDVSPCLMGVTFYGPAGATVEAIHLNGREGDVPLDDSLTLWSQTRAQLSLGRF